MFLLVFNVSLTISCKLKAEYEMVEVVSVKCLSSKCMQKILFLNNLSWYS